MNEGTCLHLDIVHLQICSIHRQTVCIHCPLQVEAVAVAVVIGGIGIAHRRQQQGYVLPCTDRSGGIGMHIRIAPPGERCTDAAFHAVAVLAVCPVKACAADSQRFAKRRMQGVQGRVGISIRRKAGAQSAAVAEAVRIGARTAGRRFFIGHGIVPRRFFVVVLRACQRVPHFAVLGNLHLSRLRKALAVVGVAEHREINPVGVARIVHNSFLVVISDIAAETAQRNAGIPVAGGGHRLFREETVHPPPCIAPACAPPAEMPSA